jgi:hypothetical protein
MKYLRPELEFVRFANVDILTDSDALPIETESVIIDEPASFDEVVDFEEPVESVEG